MKGAYKVRTQDSKGGCHLAGCCWYLRRLEEGAGDALSRGCCPAGAGVLEDWERSCVVVTQTQGVTLRHMRSRHCLAGAQGGWWWERLSKLQL